MKGGDLSWIWNFWGAEKGYSLYQTIDLVRSSTGAVVTLFRSFGMLISELSEYTFLGI
jgi:hypothetical protein